MSYDWQLPLDRWSPEQFGGGPIAPFDGMLYVDDLRKIWQFNFETAHWEERPKFFLQETCRFRIMLNAIDSSHSIWNQVAHPANRYWDGVHDKAFIQIKVYNNYTSPILTSYKAFMTKAQLDTYVRSVVPGGGQFNAEVEITVYEVVDPTIRCDRAMFYNAFYGSARGRKAYNRKHGRGADGLNYYAGLHPKFLTHWGPDAYTDVGQSFMANFHGITPPVDPNSSNIIWFGSGKNLYRMPKIGSTVVCNLNARWYWNDTAAAYQNAPEAHEFNVGIPRVFLHYRGSNVRYLNTMGTLLGAHIFSQEMSALMIFPLTNGDAGQNRYAFLMKPVGVDTLLFSLTDSVPAWDIIAENYYNGNHTVTRRPLPAPEVSEDNQWARYSLYDAISLKGGANHFSVDAGGVPRAVRFYARHPLTGLRSQPFDDQISVVRRKQNLTMGAFHFNSSKRF